MDSLKQSIGRAALGLAEFMTPVLKDSKFRETGAITPSEFVAAGDFLVHHCPTWQWSGGEPTKARPYLPASKQFLFTKGVPCYKRASQIISELSNGNRIVEEQDVDGGWVDTFFFADDEKNDDGTSKILDRTEVDLNRSEESDEDDDDGEAEDLDDFIQNGMLDEADPQVAIDRIRVPTASSTNSQKKAESSGVLQTRTYDLFITYDKYYQTARFWLNGYDEQHKPLSEAEMYEDFSRDHVKKTITTETHPHLSSTPIPSIHPCRQAEVMRKLMDTIDSSSNQSGNNANNQLGVHQYLIVFLKFVQTVIPTIEYDFTLNFKMS